MITVILIILIILLFAFIGILFEYFMFEKAMKCAEVQKIDGTFLYITLGVLGIIGMAYLISLILYPLFNQIFN